MRTTDATGGRRANCADDRSPLRIVESMSETTDPLPPLDRRGVAAALGVSTSTADRMMWTGQLRSFSVGRRRLATREAVADFIARRERLADIAAHPEAEAQQ